MPTVFSALSSAVEPMLYSTIDALLFVFGIALYLVAIPHVGEKWIRKCLGKWKEGSSSTFSSRLVGHLIDVPVRIWEKMFRRLWHKDLFADGEDSIEEEEGSIKKPVERMRGPYNIILPYTQTDDTLLSALWLMTAFSREFCEGDNPDDYSATLFLDAERLGERAKALPSFYDCRQALEKNASSPDSSPHRHKMQKLQIRPVEEYAEYAYGTDIAIGSCADGKTNIPDWEALRKEHKVFCIDCREGLLHGDWNLVKKDADSCLAVAGRFMPVRRMTGGLMYSLGPSVACLRSIAFRTGKGMEFWQRQAKNGTWLTLVKEDGSICPINEFYN